MTTPPTCGDGLVDPKADPLLVSGMRRWPTGEVRHIPTGGIGMTGTHTATFLGEYDEALAEAYRRGFRDGYAVSAQDADHARTSVPPSSRAVTEDGE